MKADESHTGLSLLAVQHGFQIGKRIEGGRTTIITTGSTVTLPGLQLPLMLIIMTVEAQEFPVTAIGRIVIMVMIPVMHGQFA
jgi:hypothetical protein